MTDKLNDAVERYVREKTPPEELRRGKRVDRAIDNQGGLILDNLNFIPLQSPDGTVWRVRVDNSGNLTTSQVSS